MMHGDISSSKDGVGDAVAKQPSRFRTVHRPLATPRSALSVHPSSASRRISRASQSSSALAISASILASASECLRKPDGSFV